MLTIDLGDWILVDYEFDFADANEEAKLRVFALAQQQISFLESLLLEHAQHAFAHPVSAAPITRQLSLKKLEHIHPISAKGIVHVLVDSVRQIEYYCARVVRYYLRGESVQISARLLEVLVVVRSDKFEAVLSAIRIFQGLTHLNGRILQLIAHPNYLTHLEHHFNVAHQLHVEAQLLVVRNRVRPCLAQFEQVGRIQNLHQGAFAPSAKVRRGLPQKNGQVYLGVKRFVFLLVFLQERGNALGFALVIVKAGAHGEP